jgi:hypothetical protein
LVSEEYINKSEQLIAKMNSVMQNRTDIEELVGVGNIDMMKNNHENHVKFIGSILKNYNPKVMVETIIWVFKAYRNHGFTTNYWPIQINTWLSILKDELSSNAYFEIYPYYEWILRNIPLFIKTSGDNLEQEKL